MNKEQIKKKPMIYYDSWYKMDIPSYTCLYAGPRLDISFEKNIKEGYYDKTMLPDILKYYKCYFSYKKEDILYANSIYDKHEEIIKGLYKTM